MDRLEDRHVVAVVARRREAEAADQPRGEVADDVAVEVRGDDDVELGRVLGHLVGDVVDDQVLGRDLRVLGGELLEGPLEEALGELHDVGLGRAGDLPAALAAGQLEGVADDLLAALAGDDLQALRDVRRLHVLDAGVQVLDVLADDDHVDALARVAGGHAGELARGADVGVRLEELAQRDVGALLAEADRRLEGALEDDPGPLDRLAGLLRHARRVAPLEDLGAGLGLLPVDGDAGRGDDPLRGPDDLRAHPVAGDDGDPVRLGGHRGVSCAGGTVRDDGGWIVTY